MPVPPERSMTILLVRHGESYSSRDGMIETTTCRGLTGVGRRQVESTADWLATRFKVSDVATSPIARCAQTAAILARRLSIEPRERPDLAPPNPGPWEGRYWRELRSARLAGSQALLSESWPSYVDRTRLAMRQAAKAPKGPVLVVACHSETVAAVTELAADAGDLGRSARAHPGSVTVVQLTTSDQSADPVLTIATDGTIRVPGATGPGVHSAP